MPSPNEEPVAPRGRSRARRVVRFVAPFVALYLVVALAARLVYPALLYPAPRREPAPLPAPWSELAPAQGLHAIAREGAAGAPVVVWFHGNGELCEDQLARGDALARRGIGFVAPEYRGYGKLAALVPSEAGIYDDAERIVAEVERDAATRGSSVVVVGYSLGSAIAAEMAHRGHGARLVLVAPFTSARAMGSAFAPFLPVSWIMTERYDTLSKAPQIRQLALVVHGDRDELVPFAMGQAVARALPLATFVPAPGAGHVGVLSVARAAEELDRFVDAAR